MRAATSEIFPFGSENSIQRVLEAGSTSNTQNIDRIYFWGKAIDEVFNYDFITILFGKFGYIKALEGGTESDWLRILLDNGIFFMSAFLIPIFLGTFYAITKKNWILLFTIVSCTVVMAVFPLAQSFSNGIFIWLFLFSLLNNHTKKRS